MQIKIKIKTHKQKVKLARKLQRHIERKRSIRIGQPKGMMISRLFNTDGWNKRKLAIANRVNKNKKCDTILVDHNTGGSDESEGLHVPEPPATGTSVL